MAVFAIGDVQGCADELQALLAEIRFSRTSDELWFTGDLVNRGPKSAEVLRFVKGLGERAHAVLGNHDLHLLALAAGHGRARAEDTLQDVLDADDRVELLEWLRALPLLHHDTRLGFTLVHAGLLPQWDLASAQKLALEAQDALRRSDQSEFFAHMYGNEPNRWDPALEGWERLRVIINSFTRLRYCDADGHMDFRCKGAPGSQPAKLIPWFQVEGRASRDLRIVFGHWSTLGRWQGNRVLGLDSGCLWGGELLAVRLDGPLRFFSVPCQRRGIPQLGG